MKEALKFKKDEALSEELDTLVKSEQAKVDTKDRAYKALWCLDMLVQDGLVDDRTNFAGIVKAIRRRISELNQTVNYGQYAIDKPTGDSTGSELKKIAQKEIESAQKLLPYLEAISHELVRINLLEFDQKAPLDFIRTRLKRKIDNEEKYIKQDEIKKRKGL